jgi:hypothetical protein
MSMQPQQQQMGSWSDKNALTIDAIVPDESTAQQAVQEFVRDQAVKQVTFSREGGTPRVRISLHSGAVSQFKDRLTRLADTIERSYQTAGYGQQQR